MPNLKPQFKPQPKCVPFASNAETLAQFQKRTGISDFSKRFVSIPEGIDVQYASEWPGSLPQISISGAPTGPEAPVRTVRDLTTVSIEDAARFGAEQLKNDKDNAGGMKSWLALTARQVALWALVMDAQLRGDSVANATLGPNVTLNACAFAARPKLSWYDRGGMTPRAGMPRAGLGDAGGQEPTMRNDEPGTVGAPMTPKFKQQPSCLSFKTDYETLASVAKRAGVSLDALGGRMTMIGGRLESGSTVQQVAQAGWDFVWAHPDWWDGPIPVGAAAGSGSSSAPYWAQADQRVMRVGMAVLSGSPVPSGVATNGAPITMCQPAPRASLDWYLSSRKPQKVTSMGTPKIGVGDPRSLPAHLRDPNYRPLKPMAITPAAAMKHNIAKNFDGLGNVRMPATLSCQEGFALYQGKCIPKSRVPGGSLAGPAPAGTTRELIDRIAAQVASRAAAKPPLYTVARNEGTSSIAQKLRVSVAALLAANPTKPTITLGSGQRVFAQLTVGEKLNVPTVTRGSTVTGGGMLAAGPGEPCGITDWCGDGYSCVDGICQPNFVPVQAGMSNEGSYCDAGGGPQSGYINNGQCVAIGGATQGGDTGNSVIGDLTCPGPNMTREFLVGPCVCEDGFVPDPNGPGCVEMGAPGTYVQADLLCTMTGGTGTNDACSCPSGFTWDWNNGCVDSKGKPGGVVGQTAQGGTGGSAGGKPGGGAKPGSGEPPVDAKGSLMGSLPSTPWLVGGALAIAAVVGGGAYAVTRSKKKAGKGKDKKADKAAKKAAKAAKKGSKLPWDSLTRRLHSSVRRARPSSGCARSRTPRTWPPPSSPRIAWSVRWPATSRRARSTARCPRRRSSPRRRASWSRARSSRSPSRSPRTTSTTSPSRCRRTTRTSPTRSRSAASATSSRRSTRGPP